LREIIFDTETTGLDSREDRIIEIGAVELVNRFPTGQTFHVYINPQGRQVHPEALAVHGISNERLANEPTFPDIVEKFLAFIEGAKLIAHNASFDMGFINAELARLGQPLVDDERVIDSLVLARRKHPMGPNSLDALCRRYGINNSHRTFHGALLEASIERGSTDTAGTQVEFTIAPRPEPLPSRLSEAERAAHAQLVEGLGEKAIWRQFDNPAESQEAALG